MKTDGNDGNKGKIFVEISSAAAGNGAGSSENEYGEP